MYLRPAVRPDERDRPRARNDCFRQIRTRCILKDDAGSPSRDLKKKVIGAGCDTRAVEAKGYVHTQVRDTVSLREYRLAIDHNGRRTADWHANPKLCRQGRS